MFLRESTNVSIQLEVCEPVLKTVGELGPDSEHSEPLEDNVGGSDTELLELRLSCQLRAYST